MTIEHYEPLHALPRERGAATRLYATGYILSLICTLAAYLLVVGTKLSPTTLVVAVVVLALLQCIVQAYCFLHVRAGKRSRPELIVLGFAILVVGILLSGSLWIMFRLNERMMPGTAQMEQYMQDQGGGF